MTTNVQLQFSPYYVPNATQVDYNPYGVDIISGAHVDDILKVYYSADGTNWTLISFTDQSDDLS